MQTQDNRPVWYEPPGTPVVPIDHEAQARLEKYMETEDAKMFPKSNRSSRRKRG